MCLVIRWSGHVTAFIVIVLLRLELLYWWPARCHWCRRDPQRICNCNSFFSVKLVNCKTLSSSKAEFFPLPATQLPPLKPNSFLLQTTTISPSKQQIFDPPKPNSFPLQTTNIFPSEARLFPPPNNNSFPLQTTNLFSSKQQIFSPPKPNSFLIQTTTLSLSESQLAQLFPPNPYSFLLIPTLSSNAQLFTPEPFFQQIPTTDFFLYQIYRQTRERDLFLELQMGKSSESFDGMWKGNECRAAGTERQAAINSGRWCKYKYVILVWPTSWTASCNTLIVCVYPGTCRHIARRMTNGWLWNFACMSGTILPTLCQILVVTQWPN